MSKQLKIALSIVAASIAAAASASAEKGLTVNVGGSVDTQMGFVKQSDMYKHINNDETKGKLENKALVNDVKLKISAEGKSHGLRYGGLVVLDANTSDKKMTFTKDVSGNARTVYNKAVASQTMIFAESSFGRLEGGSYTGAYDAMKVGAPARATGGINGDWQYWATHELSGLTGGGEFIVTPNLPTSSDRTVTANASKVTFYTPTFAGFKAGLTYIPDAGRTGTVTTIKSQAEKLGQSNNYKDVVQGGLHYSNKFDKVCAKFSLLGEYGKAKKDITTAQTNYKDFNNLKAWEVGGALGYSGFSVGGSYGDWGKSGIAKSNTVGSATTLYKGAKAGRYWTAGLGYEHANYGVSFGYMQSKNSGFKLASNEYSATKGKVEAYSFGVDYKVAPGLMPYAEFTHFNVASKAHTNATTGIYPRNKGSVVLVGTKLEF